MRNAAAAVFIAFLIAAPSPAPAQQIDYQCLNDCQAAGYLYRFCKEKCSFGADDGFAPQSPIPPRRIDYRCQTDCLGQGYRLQYCQELCSY